MNKSDTDSDDDRYSTKSMSSTLTLSEESESEGEINNRKPRINDWLLVKFDGKKSVKRFVGKIINIENEGVKVQFARRIADSKFNWPTIEDVAVVDDDQIEMILRPPIINSKNDRIVSFIFKTGFQGISVS